MSLTKNRDEYREAPKGLDLLLGLDPRISQRDDLSRHLQSSISRTAAELPAAVQLLVEQGDSSGLRELRDRLTGLISSAEAKAVRARSPSDQLTRLTAQRLAQHARSKIEHCGYGAAFAIGLVTTDAHPEALAIVGKECDDILTALEAAARQLHEKA